MTTPEALAKEIRNIRSLILNLINSGLSRQWCQDDIV